MKRAHADLGDELLNAYLDEQLDADERGRILQALREDRQLAERVCALRQVKELTRHAYVGPDAHSHTERHPTRAGGRRRAVAALALTMAGGALGWWGHDRVSDRVTQAQMMQLADVQPERLIRAAVRSERVVLHISSNQPQRLAAALDTVDYLLHAAQRAHDKLEVEVIVNSDGLDLLRTETSHHAARVSALAARFHNVHFLACGKAVERLHRQGVQVNLLPEAEVSEPALDLILERMRQGWLYVAA